MCQRERHTLRFFEDFFVYYRTPPSYLNGRRNIPSLKFPVAKTAIAEVSRRRDVPSPKRPSPNRPVFYPKCIECNNKRGIIPRKRKSIFKRRKSNT